MKAFRTETDSMGEMQVPADALYGAQTARALENFPISGLRFPREFLRALGLIKKHAALTNVAQCKSYLEQSLGLCTALAPVIGYDQAARIAKVAHETRRTVREVALELSGVDKADLEALLDPARQTEPGLMGAGTGGAERDPRSRSGGIPNTSRATQP